MNVNNIIGKLESIAELVRFFNFDFDVVDDYELTKNEIKTLIQLKFRSGQSLSYYSEKIGLKKGSFTSLTNKLEDKGLIEKSYLKNDKRTKVLIPTDKGIEITEKLYNGFVNYLTIKLSKLSDTDKILMESAINILSKINLV